MNILDVSLSTSNDMHKIKLAYDKYAQTHNINLGILLALNPNCPTKILLKLLETNSVELQTAVLEHKNIPTTILQKYVTSTDKRILRAIVQNPNLNIDIISQLLNVQDALTQYHIITFALKHNLPQIWLRFYDRKEWMDHINKYLKKDKIKNEK